MSNFLNLGYTNLNDLVNINASDINTQTLTTTQLNANGDINIDGDIVSGDNIISFNNSTLFTNFAENVHIYGSLFLDYQGTTYNVGQELATGGGGGGGGSYPSITYDSSSNTTSFTGSLVFPSSSIDSASINNNSRFVELTTSQVISNKEFSGTTVFSSIQLNNSLILNSGGLTLPQSTLQNIQFLSGITSDLNTRLTTNETKTTNMSFASNITSFSGTLSFPTASISFNAIVGTACTLGQNQTITGTKSFSSVQNFTSNLRLDGSLLVGTTGNVNLTNSTLQKIAFLGDTTSAIGANLTSLQNQINGINTDLDGYALQSTVQSILDTKIGTMIYYEPTDFTIVNNFLTNGELQYTPDGSTKINLIPIITSLQDKLLKVTRNSVFDFFDIDSNCHIYGKLQLGNYPDIEYSLNAVIIAEGVTAAATALNTAALLTMTTTTIPAINLRLTGLEVDVGDLETAVALLENKTQKISYSNFDNTTTISAITSINNLKVGNLESGLIQTENLNVRFIGVTELRNDFIITNGFGCSIDGGINQIQANQTSTFAGVLTVNNDFTSGGTNTNINSTNCKIAGITSIKTNSTNPILSVVLPSTVGQFNAQGILIGKEQTNGQARNCNIGYNYDADGSVNNYGYLGLNVMAGAGNLKESFRWFSSGCAIPTGNLTISTGDLTVTAGNVSVPAGSISLTTGNVNLTDGNVALTNGDLSIINGDAFLTSGTLSLTNGDCNLTNGDINLVSGELKTNTISNQSGTALDINANNINIGTNQGVLGLNTVYIGNALSGTIIYLNGAVSSPYSFNVTGVFSQWT